MREILHIGQVGKLLGLNPKTIRYYEEIGLLPKPKRTRGGYRLYSPADVERINFIRQARALGLSLDEIRGLLRLRDAGGPLPANSQRLIEEQVKQIERHVADLRWLQRELSNLCAKTPSDAENEARRA
jgi:DNA-binding transcriptional MerR regulator